ncbi:MAG: recombinase family protein [Planctomycetota bacterium]
MTIESSSKVTVEHLKRSAYVYVRQSTLQQVRENTESTVRQYGLFGKAVALGWPPDQIVILDGDLGQSGASAVDRAGFQRLVADVSIGKVGIVLGLEVSRLARNSSDWHRLLELCAFSQTLILDDDGLYDPMQFNDRLLLGLKGTMSEAELHVLSSRLRGGALSKARRGEFRTHLPIGLLHDEQGRVILDPDRQVQESIRLFYQTFFRLGTALATVRLFRQQHLLFPRRVKGGSRHGELLWGSLNVGRAVQLLHNPRLAGAYVYGRYHHRRGPEGRVKKTRQAREQWFCLIRDAHPGYITWEQFEEIEQRLTESARAYGADHRHGPAREGPALLQGLAVCGRCGGRMSVRYHHLPSGLKPQYFCVNRGPTMSESPCQIIDGAGVDRALGELIIEVFQPAALEVAVAVQEEVKGRLEESDRYRRRTVERAQYEADLSRRRYMKVDPDNRMVADSLEAEWNEKLRAVGQAQQDYEEQRAADESVLTAEARGRIANLAEEFPALWRDPRTPARERKRMLALLIEDVTLTRKEQIAVQIRFRGGATRTLEIATPLNAWQRRSTNPKVVRLIDELLHEHTDAQVAEILRGQNLVTGAENPFAGINIAWVRKRYELKSFKQRLVERGMISMEELCRRFGICRDTARD